jgi:ATP-dependent helicase IRC3
VVSPSPLRRKTLVLAHRTELLSQAYLAITKFCPEVNIGMDFGSKSPDYSSEIIIASVNALGRKDSKRLDRYNPEEFKLIVIGKGIL